MYIQYDVMVTLILLFVFLSPPRARRLRPRPRRPRPPRPRRPPAKAKLVTNIWVDMDIRQVVQDIAAQTETVILCDQTVQGMVSMSVKDMPLTDCLERVCAAGGYSYTQVKDYFLIGKAEPGIALFQRLLGTAARQADQRDAGPGADAAASVAAELRDVRQGQRDAGGDGAAALAGEILSSIAQFDQPNPQVAIEAVVFELTEDGSKQLALDWQFKSGNFALGSDNLMQTLTYSARRGPGTYVQATLRAIVESRKGQVLANPRVLVMNNTEAEIFVGQEKYFTLLSGQASNPYYTLQSIEPGTFQISFSSNTLLLRPQRSS